MPHLIQLLGEFDRGEISEVCLSHLLGLYLVDRLSGLHKSDSKQRCYCQCNSYQGEDDQQPCGYVL